tara:strand:- start:387 stop:836 length:450 start_codon:yes stop_codon:yes gene_type:complete
MPPFVLPALGLLGAGVAANEIKKAGQNRAIIEMFKDGKLGSPTGGFGYQTGFGPGMLLPTSGYQSILNYNQQMSDQQRKALVENLLAVEPITDRAKKRDFERNMAAARFRTQLGTQQGLTLQGQLGAQRLAQDAQRAAGTALASNYQYQ